LQTDTYRLLIITSTGDRLFRFINIDDLESPKKEFLVNFSQFLDKAHISTLNCDEMAGIDEDNLRMKFSALNVDFSSPSSDPLSWRRPAQAGVKDGYPIKVVILPLMARVAWKRLQIGTDMLLTITSTGDRLFRFINIDALERPSTPKRWFLVIFSNF